MHTHNGEVRPEKFWNAYTGWVMRISDWLRQLRRPSKQQRSRRDQVPNANVAKQIEQLEARTLLTVFVVDSTADDIDANDGETTLREAITNANLNAGADSIHFDLPGNAPFTIQPTSALPIISGDLTIDGTTQSGFNGAPIIELDGSNAGGGTDGLDLANGNSTVRGLVINRFGGDARLARFRSRWHF